MIVHLFKQSASGSLCERFRHDDAATYDVDKVTCAACIAALPRVLAAGIVVHAGRVPNGYYTNRLDRVTCSACIAEALGRIPPTPPAPTVAALRARSMTDAFRRMYGIAAVYTAARDYSTRFRETAAASVRLWTHATATFVDVQAPGDGGITFVLRPAVRRTARGEDAGLQVAVGLCSPRDVFTGKGALVARGRIEAAAVGAPGGACAFVPGEVPSAVGPDRDRAILRVVGMALRAARAGPEIAGVAKPRWLTQERLDRFARAVGKAYRDAAPAAPRRTVKVDDRTPRVPVYVVAVPDRDERHWSGGMIRLAYAQEPIGPGLLVTAIGVTKEGYLHVAPAAPPAPADDAPQPPEDLLR